MKKIILSIATSKDYFIADALGGLEWLTDFPNPTHTDYGRKDFLNKIDTVILGGRMFRHILNMDIIWPYKDKLCYVVSRFGMPTSEKVKFITRHIPVSILALKHEPGKDIWLAGGGVLCALMLEHDLIDEIRITTIPVELGKGVPLFVRSTLSAAWEITDNVFYPNGVVQTIYTRKAKELHVKEGGSLTE